MAVTPVQPAHGAEVATPGGRKAPSDPMEATG